MHFKDLSMDDIFDPSVLIGTATTTTDDNTVVRQDEILNRLFNYSE